jgi:hypothetical protein
MTRLVKIEKGMGNHVKIKIFLGSIYYPHGETQNLFKQNGLGRFDFAFPKSSH